MDLMETLKKVPWWGWAGGGGVALGGIYLFHKHSAANPTPAQQVSSAPVPSGLSAADLAGMPFDYQDYQPANPLGTVGSDVANTGTPAYYPYTPPGWPSSPPGPPDPAPTPSTSSQPFTGPDIQPFGRHGPPGPPQPAPGAFTLNYGDALTHMPSENPWLEHARPPIA